MYSSYRYYMSSRTSPHHGLVVLIFIGLCTAIGYYVSVQFTGDVGSVKTWFWIGIGLAGIYLLTVITNNLDQI